MLRNTNRPVLGLITLLTALPISICAGYYSITGLSKLFSGAVIAVIIMATCLELGKVILTVVLHKYWRDLRFMLKLYLTLSVLILMIITSTGIYGFLTDAFQDTYLKIKKQEKSINYLNNLREKYELRVIESKKQDSILRVDISTLRTALSTNKQQYTDRKGNLIITSSNSNRKTYERELKELSENLQKNEEYILRFQDSIDNIDTRLLNISSIQEIGSEIGPISYISKNLNLPIEQTVHYLILILIFVFDPLAIGLILTGSYLLNKSENKKISSPKITVEYNNQEEKNQSKSDKNIRIFTENDTLIDPSILQNQSIENLEKYKLFYTALKEKYPERSSPYEQILSLIETEIQKLK